MKNARYFEKQGVVKVLSQSELNSEKFLITVTSLLKELPKWKINRREGLVITDAAKRVALETILLGSEKMAFIPL